ncbi:MAG TPA: DmsE family decaheme c-type cytochrome [Thermodesulfobacteriaceae bacterium]|nr:DmsE family decaheme c-type cytochrome [Thermodesulfobacteriaceae bacterium]
MFRRFFFIAAGLAFLIGCTQMYEKRAAVVKTPVISEGAEYVGSETCLECHEDYEGDHNVHMKLASYEATGYQLGCEGCHGPGSAHADAEDPALILRYGEEGLHPEEVSGVCLTCHQGGAMMNWTSSEHAFFDVACTSCHSIHFNKHNDLLKEKQTDLCTSCHIKFKAKLYYPSHHPMKEGKMSCDSCHNPHGSATGAPGMLKTEERVNDLCLDCHTRYQGPFVFEHAPVAESCLECHDPHGTVANNLLKQNEPFLCLQCHEGHFHAMRTGEVKPPKYNSVHTGIHGGRTDDGDTRLVITGHGPTDWAKGFLTKCTTCHQEVHGSDLPSQTRRLEGGALTR